MNNRCRYICKAKRKDNNEWVVGFAIFADNKAFILNNAKVEFITGFNENRLNFVLVEVIPETVGQFKEKCKDINTARKVIRLQAIREFAERLKSKLDNLEFRTKTHRKTVPTKFCDDSVNWVLHECVPQEIDNLVKEMKRGCK